MKKLLFILSFIAFNALAQIDLTSNIIANYPLNGNANDVSANNLNGSIFGNIVPTTDRFGNANGAYFFGGTNSDYIAVPHNDLLNFSNESFSLSVWAFRTGLSFNGILVNKGGDIVDGYSIRVNADGNSNAGFRLNNPSRWFFDNDDIRTPTDIIDNTWTNYTGTYDNATRTMRFYENGKMVAEKIIFTNFVQNNTLDFTIGQHSTATKNINSTTQYPFTGAIDDVILYGRTMNHCEAYSLFHALPTTLSAITNVTVCSGSVVSLSASGLDLALNQTYQWFNQSISGTTLSGAANYTVSGLTQNTVFYVGYQAGSCPSETRIPVTVTVLQIPTAPVVSNQSVCGVGGVTFTGVASEIINWYDTSVAGTSLGTGSLFAIPLLTATSTYFVSNTDNNGCVSTLTSAIASAFTKPSISGLNGSYSVCPSVTSIGYGVASISGQSNQWFISGGTIDGASMGDSINVNWGNTNSEAKVKVLPTSSFGCVGDTLIKNVTVNVVLATETPNGNDTLCLFDAKNISYQITPTNGSVYTWSVVNGILNSSQNNSIIASATTSGMMKLTVLENVTTSSNVVCKGQSDTLFVTVNPNPDSTVSIGGASELCQSGSSDYTLSGLVGSTYSWTVSGATQPTGAGNLLPGISFPSAGIATISGVETTNKGCKGKVIHKFIRVDPVATTKINLTDTAVCFNLSQNKIYTTNGFSNSAFIWSVSNPSWQINNPSNTSTIGVNLTSVGMGYIKVIESISGINICPNFIDSILVNVYPNPDTTLQIEGRKFICGDNSLQILSIAGFANSTYQWLVNSTVPSSITGRVITTGFTTIGNNFIKVTETSNKGCLGKEISDILTISGKFGANLYTNKDSFCTSDISVNVNADNKFVDSKFEWSTDNPNWKLLLPNPSPNQIFIISVAGTGKLIAKEIPIVANACTNNIDTLAITVNQSPLPNRVIQGKELICFSAPNEPYTISGILPNSAGNWIYNSRQVAGGKERSFVNINISSLKDRIEHSLVFQEVTEFGCVSNSIPKSIFVYPQPPTSISGLNTSCTDGSSVVTYSVTGIANSKFVWDVKSTNADIVATDTSLNTITLKFDSTKSFSTNEVKVVQIIAQTCVGDTAKFPVLYYKIDVQGVSISETDSTQTEINYDIKCSNCLADIPRMIISKNDSLINSQVIELANTSLNFKPLQNSTQVYQHKIQYKNLCGNTVFSPIHHNMLLKAEKDNDVGGITLKWNSYIGWKNGVQSYEIWRKTESSASFELYQTLNDTISPKLIVANDGALQSFKIKSIGSKSEYVAFSNIITMAFDNSLRIYNAFTPDNNDDKNDTWKIDRINLYPNNKLTIMDKWGTEIFSKNGYLGEWDGTHKGEKLPSGVYYYVLELGNSLPVKSGTITLIR